MLKLNRFNLFHFRPISAMALLWLLFIIGFSLIMEFQFPFGPPPQPEQLLQLPQFKNIMGTDSLGRDLLTRVGLGTRISLMAGLFGSLLALFIGTLVGLICGMGPSVIDRILMRVTDMFISLPSFILISVLSLALMEIYFSPLLVLCFAIGLTHWMVIAKTVRGYVKQLQTSVFIEGAIALGASSFRISWRHMLPHLAPQLWVLFAIQLPNSILYESFMSFIGLGIQSPQTSWGILIQEGWRSLSVYPHLILFPCLVLFLTIWSLNTLFQSKKKFRSIS